MDDNMKHDFKELSLGYATGLESVKDVAALLEAADKIYAWCVQDFKKCCTKNDTAIA